MVVLLEPQAKLLSGKNIWFILSSRAWGERSSLSLELRILLHNFFVYYLIARVNRSRNLIWTTGSKFIWGKGVIDSFKVLDFPPSRTVINKLLWISHSVYGILVWQPPKNKIIPKLFLYQISYKVSKIIFKNPKTPQGIVKGVFNDKDWTLQRQE